MKGGSSSPMEKGRYSWQPGLFEGTPLCMESGSAGILWLSDGTSRAAPVQQ